MISIRKIHAGDVLPENELLSRCLRMSDVAYEGAVDGKMACVWGLIPPTLLSNQAYLWLYTTDLVKDHTFLLVRHSQLAIEEALEKYPLLVGHCSIDAPRSIRWLKWLGAEFGEPEGRGVPFRIEKHG